MNSITKGHKIKEGFLVKKGHIRHSWKTRWFVLYDFWLAYFKKKEDSEPAGCFSLVGCTVVSPSPKEYSSRPLAFLLTTGEGKRYLIEAISKEERKSWVIAIGEAVRKSHTAISTASTPMASAINYSELITAMQNPDAGIKLSTHTTQQTEYKHCFSGEEVVHWLLDWSFTKSFEDSIKLATQLLLNAYIQPLNTGPNIGFSNTAESVYMFPILQLSEDESDEDSNDERDHSSDEDFSETSSSSKKLQGSIIKQGFLIKRGHVRRTWKTRKCVLRRSPAYMHYYKGSKAVKEKHHLKVINLRGCKVELLDAITEESGGKNICHGNLFKVLTAKNKTYIFQAHTIDERNEWIKAILSSLCSI